MEIAGETRIVNDSGDVRLEDVQTFEELVARLALEERMVERATTDVVARALGQKTGTALSIVGHRVGTMRESASKGKEGCRRRRSDKQRTVRSSKSPRLERTNDTRESDARVGPRVSSAGLFALGSRPGGRPGVRTGMLRDDKEREDERSWSRFVAPVAESEVSKVVAVCR